MEAVGTRERIVAAARELFHERGYTAVGVADICGQANVVKGSFYHFFASKDELLGEVVRRNWDQLHGVLLTLEADDRTARESVAALFDFILDDARRSHRETGRILGCRIGTLASEIGASDVSGSDSTRVAMDGWRRSMRRILKRGRADGSIDPDLDVAATADSLLATIQGMSVIGRALHRPALLKRIARQALQQLPGQG